MVHTIPRMACVSLLCLVASALHAAPPHLEQIDLFTAGEGGYFLYRIPGIVVTAKGAVLAYGEARRFSASDWGTIDLVMRRSTDGGRTWDEPRTLPRVAGPIERHPQALAQKLARPDDVTYNNPVAIADRSGAVHLLFCVEYMRCFYTRSDDDGLTWSEPREITAAFDAFRPQYDWRVLATGPGHGIQLRSGRLVVPVWLSLATGPGAHKPSLTASITSDDGGATWQAGQIAVPDTDEWIDPNETAAVELADGRVMFNVRSLSRPNRRLVVTSPDGATGWSTPRFDEALVEPICMASIVRLSKTPESDKNRIVFANPHNLEVGKGKGKPGAKRDRKNLSVKLSYDEGQTWPVNKVLEPGPSAYSDLAVAADGTILCFYERRRPAPTGDTTEQPMVMTVARFNLEWLTDRGDSLGNAP